MIGSMCVNVRLSSSFKRFGVRCVAGLGGDRASNDMKTVDV